jgi:hypothetical protein
VARRYRAISSNSPMRRAIACYRPSSAERSWRATRSSTELTNVGSPLS